MFGPMLLLRCMAHQPQETLPKAPVWWCEKAGKCGYFSVAGVKFSPPLHGFGRYWCGRIRMGKIPRQRRAILGYGAVLFALAAIGIPVCRGADSASLVAHKDSAWTTFFQRTSGWTAGDGAISVRLADGRVIWLFGDSHVNDFDPQTKTLPALFQVRNAAMIHPAKKPTQAATHLLNSPTNRNLFQHPDGGKFWFWPQAGFEYEKAVYIYLVALEPRGEPGNFDFKTSARYWAKMPLPNLKPITYSKLPDSNDIDFGCGFARDDEAGDVLAFGQKGNGFETSVFLARFKPSAPERDWKYWNGKSWDKNAATVAPVTKSASVSISASKIRGKYVLVSSALSVGCDMGKDIFVSTSNSPIGPFSPIKKIYTIDDTADGHYPFFYIPTAHPEFINENDEILVTYCINGYEPCVPMSVNGRMNPDHYRPKAIRVPLKLISSDL